MKNMRKHVAIEEKIPSAERKSENCERSRIEKNDTAAKLSGKRFIHFLVVDAKGWKKFELFFCAYSGGKYKEDYFLTIFFVCASKSESVFIIIHLRKIFVSVLRL